MKPKTKSQKFADFEKCISNILSNFNMPQVRLEWFEHHNKLQYQALLDVHTAGMAYFEKREITNQKEYRQLRNLIRCRLIGMTLDVKMLAEETLEQLGYNETKN